MRPSVIFGLILILMIAFVPFNNLLGAKILYVYVF